MFSISLIVLYLAHGALSFQDIPSALCLLMGIADGIILGGALHTFRRTQLLRRCGPQQQFLEWLQIQEGYLRLVLAEMSIDDPHYTHIRDISQAHKTKIAEYESFLSKGMNPQTK